MAQVPENLSVGVYGRQENNFYKYFENNDASHVRSTRSSLGYSAGIAIHSSVTYFLNAELGFGFSEQKYSPGLKGYENGQSTTLYDINLRMYHLNATAELKLGDHKFVKPAFFLGLQGNFIRDFTTQYDGYGGVLAEYPGARFKLQTGFAVNIHLKKDRFLLKPYMGFRVPMSKARAYENSIDQFFFGLTLAVKVKTF